MPKTRVQKEKLVNKYHEVIDGSKMTVILGYKGLPVEESENIRQKFFENNEDFVIVKNNLLKLALKKNKLELPDEFYSQPLAIASSATDEAQVSKDINEFAKRLEVLEVVGGIYEGKVVEKDIVLQLASLPSKEQLLAQTVFVIASPLTGLVNVIRGPLSGLVNVLNQVQSKKIN